MNNRVMNRRGLLRAGGMLSGATGIAALTGCLPTQGGMNSAASMSTMPSSIPQTSAPPQAPKTFFNILDFGAKGDGVNDDAPAIQAAINAAQADGGAVIIPGGSFRISRALKVTSRVTIQGIGCQGDMGNYINNQYHLPMIPANGYKGSTLIAGNHNAIEVETNAAISFESFQIVYPVKASDGMTAIRLSAAPGSTSANCFSVLRDVCINGASIGIMADNFYSFTFDNCTLLSCTYASMELYNTNFTSWGDNLIVNCSMFSMFVNHHIAIYSGGGYRILNNMIGGSKVADGVGIAIVPNVKCNIEPLMIVGNTIEGQPIGIHFEQAHPEASTSALVIASNEIWTGGIAIGSKSGVASNLMWINGMTINGNVLMVLENYAVAMKLDGIKNTVMTGNVFVGGGTNTTALQFGAQTENVKHIANVATGCVYKE